LAIFLTVSTKRSSDFVTAEFAGGGIEAFSLALIISPFSFHESPMYRLYVDEVGTDDLTHVEKDKHRFLSLTA